jgi:hypothetical protein
MGITQHKEIVKSVRTCGRRRWYREGTSISGETKTIEWTRRVCGIDQMYTRDNGVSSRQVKKARSSMSRCVWGSKW